MSEATSIDDSRSRKRLVARYDIGQPDGTSRRVSLIGREVWAIGELLAAGEKGCTPIDQPAPRWSHYVFLLRRKGIEIDTIHEPHGGAFAGHHARYILKSQVERVTADAGQVAA